VIHNFWGSDGPTPRALYDRIFHLQKVARESVDTVSANRETTPEKNGGLITPESSPKTSFKRTEAKPSRGRDTGLVTPESSSKTLSKRPFSYVEEPVTPTHGCKRAVKINRYVEPETGLRDDSTVFVSHLTFSKSRDEDAKAEEESGEDAMCSKVEPDLQAHETEATVEPNAVTFTAKDKETEMEGKSSRLASPFMEKGKIGRRNSGIEVVITTAAKNRRSERRVSFD
jgi:hypothetical protein